VNVGHIFFDVRWAGLVAVDFDARAKAEVEVQATKVVDGHGLDGVSVGLSCGDIRRRRGGGKFCVNRLVSRCQRLWVENNGMHGISRCGGRGSHSSGDSDCGGMRE
jgi:hypothetical protein